MDKDKQKITDQILLWTEEEVAEMLKQYNKKHTDVFKKEVAKLYATEIEKKLIENGIVCCCKNCGSINFTRRGKDSHNQRFICKDCNKDFTAVTGTFLQNSNLSWKAWVKIIEMTINGLSFEKMQNILDTGKEYDCAGIHKATVILAVHKFLNALLKLPQPILKGVIQIDEKHFRESQKGTIELINYMPTVYNERLPRYGAQSSSLGVMSNDYINVPTAVDEEGYVVAKVACMGKLGIDIFVDLFYDHIKNASIICTDANNTYTKFCRQFHITHYIRHSKYTSVLSQAGYVFGPKKTDEQKAKNEEILEKLYNERKIDYIANRGYLPYSQFKAIKDQYKLSLSAVNSFHNTITRRLTVNKTSVANKHLNKYIHLMAFIKNWKVRTGKSPSSVEDAEEILLYVLKNTKDTVYTLEDYRKEEFDIPKTTTKYIDLLAAMTSEARILFNNKYLKFNEEDRVYDFKKREYLLDCPDSWIRQIAREHGIQYSQKGKRFNKFNVTTQILALEDINSIIIQLLLKEKKIHIEAEDADLLTYLGLTDLDLSINAPLDETYGRHLPSIREDSPLYNPNIYPTAEQIEEYKEERLAKKHRKQSGAVFDDDEDDDTLPF